MPSTSTAVPPKPHRRRCRAPESPALHPPAQLLSLKPSSAGHQTLPAAAPRLLLAPCPDKHRAAQDMATTGRPQVHAAVRVHIPARIHIPARVHIPTRTEDAYVGVHRCPKRRCGRCRGTSPCPATGGWWEMGWRQFRNVFFSIRHQERSTGRKGSTNPQLTHSAPRTHPGLRYTAHVCTLLSCLGAVAAARDPNGTAATAPLLSLSPSPARAEGTVSQGRWPSRRHGVCHTHHTPAKTRCGYKLDRFSDSGAFCSSLHLWTISPPLKCFTLFITFHLTPATSSK